MEDELAVEAYAHVSLSLKRFGLSSTRQNDAWHRARRLRVPPRTSDKLLQETDGLAELLLDWSSDEKYLDESGRPRVLSISGPGLTFETLAKLHLPTVPLPHLVALALSTSEVATLPGGRIALLGSALVKLTRIHTRPMAFAIRQIAHILETSLHNARASAPIEQRRVQRLVTGLVAARDVAQLRREFEKQVAALLNRADASLRRRRPTSAEGRKRATAISVGVYVAQEANPSRNDPHYRIAAQKPRRPPLKSSINGQ